MPGPIIDPGPHPDSGPAQYLALIAREIQTCDDNREFDKGLDIIIQAIQTPIQQQLQTTQQTHIAALMGGDPGET